MKYTCKTIISVVFFYKTMSKKKGMIKRWIQIALKIKQKFDRIFLNGICQNAYTDIARTQSLAGNAIMIAQK